MAISVISDLTVAAAAVGVRFTSLMVYVLLNDGREIGVPLSRLPWLAKATPEQRSRWSLEPQGYAVWWEELDDGIEVAHLLNERVFA